ncbi:MAG: tyrosine-type recombinase/integrase [Lachnospiraceae bacterium]|nr:tyrosine-type recombinase/integrase [Lachnospiraceae bacterium]
MSQQKELDYHKQLDIDYTLRLRAVLDTMAPFVKDFFRAIEPRTSAKTRISYAYDIRVFFNFLIETHPTFNDYLLNSFKLSDLENIEAYELEEYLEYLKVYRDTNDRRQVNTEKGLARKLSSLRSFYHYFYKRERISKNPALLLDTPKFHEKAIIRLDVDEIALLLDYVEHGGNQLSGQRKVYFEKTKNRDLAILTLLLGTGIRVSECVGLDIQDVDFKNNGIHITRKGGSEMVVYFGDEVENALKSYILVDRAAVTPVIGHNNALFLSTQRKRMGIQAVENMVKKYAAEVIPHKKITPHKLRSTYGTELYKETGDIYLVADVLGHKDVNTTKKHYAAIDENRRRRAAQAVQLREK